MQPRKVHNLSSVLFWKNDLSMGCMYSVALARIIADCRMKVESTMFIRRGRDRLDRQVNRQTDRPRLTRLILASLADTASLLPSLADLRSSTKLNNDSLDCINALTSLELLVVPTALGIGPFVETVVVAVMFPMLVAFMRRARRALAV